MRLSTLMLTIVCVVFAAFLYSVKYRVQEIDAQIRTLNTQIAEESSSIHILSAEWSYLTRPERLRELAVKHLDMQPMDGRQMAQVADLPYSEEGAAQMAQNSRAPGATVLTPAALAAMRGGVQVAGLPYGQR